MSTVVIRPLAFRRAVELLRLVDQATPPGCKAIEPAILVHDGGAKISLFWINDPGQMFSVFVEGEKDHYLFVGRIRNRDDRAAHCGSLEEVAQEVAEWYRAAAAAARWYNAVSADDKDHQDRKSTRLNSSHIQKSRMPSSA